MKNSTSKYLKIHFTNCLLLCSLVFYGQTANTIHQEVGPKGGLNKLALLYYGIEFTKEHRKEIEGVEIEFVFEVDETGKAQLAELNGVANSIIEDSLMSKNKEMIEFLPSIKDGIAQSAFYFMKLTLPSYQETEIVRGWWMADAYREAKLEDFAVLKKSNRRFDILFGGAVNQFIGSPSNYLKIGGGIKMDLTYANQNQYYYGLLMAAYFNGRKKDYSISSTREQFSSVPSIVMGAIIGKWYDKFGLQAELSFAAQNITEKLNDSDKDWVQFRGFSPALVLNYPMRFGKDKPYYYYGSPALYSNYMNLHLGVRHWFLSEKEASGLMLEFGLAYRLVVHGINEYQFRKEYQERF